MKKRTILLALSICLGVFCLSAFDGYSQCPDMSHPLAKEAVKKYANNYKVLVALNVRFALKQINLSKEELECLLKTADKIKLIAASYSAFNARNMVAIIELNIQGSSYFYDLDELFPPAKEGKKHLSFTK